ncbi:hypothetical protein ACH42_05575 [Endozoicomonas sp. (ex Bugula neritina AB1)]|nr:hypothetical protein ACH42_05575 [Endozoicomonas sp. (ex Bugula neritina AB1)]
MNLIFKACLSLLLFYSFASYGGGQHPQKKPKAKPWVLEITTPSGNNKNVNFNLFIYMRDGLASLFFCPEVGSNSGSFTISGIPLNLYNSNASEEERTPELTDVTIADIDNLMELLSFLREEDQSNIDMEGVDVDVVNNNNVHRSLTYKTPTHYFPNARGKRKISMSTGNVFDPKKIEYLIDENEDIEELYLSEYDVKLYRSDKKDDRGDNNGGGGSPMDVRYQFDQTGNHAHIFRNLYSIPKHILKADDGGLGFKYLLMQQWNGALIDTPYPY